MSSALTVAVFASLLLGAAGGLAANWIPRRWAVLAFVLLVVVGGWLVLAQGTDAPDGATSSVIAVLPQVAPYEIEKCEALTHNYGNWKPSKDALESTARPAATGICYNYFELDPARFTATLMACTTHLNTETVRLHLVLDDNRCWLEIRSAALGGRSWLRLESVYVRGNQVGNQIDVFEVGEDAPEVYARYWQCEGTRQDAMSSTVPPGNSDGPSAKMRAEWSELPPQLRGFFCTGQLVGPDLSKH